MKYAIPILLIALTSCGKMKKTASTSVETLQQEIVELSNQLTTTTETADTLFTIPADSSSWTVPAEMLTDTTSLFFEDSSVAVEIIYRPATKTITTKAKVKERSVPVVIQRTTTTISSQKTETTTNKKLKNKDIEKDRESWSAPVLTMLIYGALLLALFYFTFKNSR